MIERYNPYYEIGDFEYEPEWYDEDWELESFGEILGEDCRGFEIDPVNYIKWVQRSLNRILKSGLTVDGKVSDKYRNAVRQFQQGRGINPTGQVNEKTQDKLIKANEADVTYMTWVQQALNKHGAGLLPDGKTGTQTKNAIKAFQNGRVPDLCVDGLVGAKTELRLIQAGGGLPPGHIEGKVAADVSPAFVLKVKPYSFRNSADINDFFRRNTGSDFVDWFNTNIGGRGSWVRRNGQSLRIGSRRNVATRKTRFNRIWDRIPVMFGRPSINLFQFLSLMSIIVNETGGGLEPISERVGRPGHPGIAYAFDRISGVKISYNYYKKGLSNRKACDLFNDPVFLKAHGHLREAGRVRYTTDTRWCGDRYPAGFETDPKVRTIIREADFYKFRGRGLIQTTFRGAYKRLIDYIQSHSSISHPIVDKYRRKWKGLSSETVATISTNDDWDELFMKTDLLIPAIGVYLHSRKYLDMPMNAGVLSGKGHGSIWNVGRRVSGTKSYADKFRSRVMQMLNALGNGTP
jgi:hypothetical protein